MRIEVRVRMVSGGLVTRHYVLAGHTVALCGRETLRPPTHAERWARTCRQCEANLSALEQRRG